MSNFRAVYAPHENLWRWMDTDTSIIAGRGETPELARADAENNSITRDKIQSDSIHAPEGYVEVTVVVDGALDECET